MSPFVNICYGLACYKSEGTMRGGARSAEKKDPHRRVFEDYASAAQRKPALPVELSGVLELRAATR